MKITKKVREEAALICAASASHSASRPHWSVDIAIGMGLNADPQAASLAAQAILHAGRHLAYEPTEPGRLWPRSHDAEAEAMLRTGWCP